MHDKEAHSKPIEELLSDFETHLKRGLTQVHAQERLAKCGANELTERPRPGFFGAAVGSVQKFPCDRSDHCCGDFNRTRRVRRLRCHHVHCGAQRCGRSLSGVKDADKNLSRTVGLPKIYFYCPMMERRGVTPSFC